MARQPPGRAGGTFARRRDFDIAENFPQLFEANTARPQQHGYRPGNIEYGRLDPERAWPAVEDHRNPGTLTRPALLATLSRPLPNPPPLAGEGRVWARE